MTTPETTPDPIRPTTVRYIKLGRGGAWAEQALARGEIPFRHSAVPHELAASADRPALGEFLVQQGRSPGTATGFAREIDEFCRLGRDCLWITFARGLLWWAFADPAVVMIEPREEGRGARIRRTIGGWKHTSLLGRPLLIAGLSTKLTKVSGFRQTICNVEAEEYVIRKINGEEEPAVRDANVAREGAVRTAGELIAALHWKDFETLVDLIFTRGGWHRISALGGTMKDIDLRLEQPITGETAFVQVKSRASRARLEASIEQFHESGNRRMFFVCHSPQGTLGPVDDQDVQVRTRNELAEGAVQAGLYDWLIQRAG
jgi:hypothetical protein